MIEFSLTNKDLVPFSKRLAYFLANKFRAAIEVTSADSNIDALPATGYDDFRHSIIFFGAKSYDDVKDNSDYNDMLFDAGRAANELLFGDLEIAGDIKSTSKNSISELDLLATLDKISNEKPLGGGAYSIVVELKDESAACDLIVKPTKFPYSAYVSGGDLNGLLTNLLVSNVKKLERKIEVLVSSVKIVDGDKTYSPMFSNYRSCDRFLLSCLALAIKENFYGIKKSSNLHHIIKR